MNRLLSFVDALSTALAYVAMAAVAVLVGDMLYEVVARRLFSAPTLWAYDIAYMTNGALFLLAAGYTLMANEHIRIDFLSTRFPRKAQDAVNAAVYILLVFPLLSVVCWGAIEAAWSAYATGELEPSSPWKPLIWPFYAAIALGFCAFFLQCAAQCVRHIGAMLGHNESPLERSEEEGL